MHLLLIRESDGVWELSPDDIGKSLWDALADRDFLPFGYAVPLCEDVTGLKFTNLDLAVARPRPIRAAFIRMLARRGNVTEAEAAQALADIEAESGRSFLDWLLDGGLEKLIELILKLLPFLMTK